MNDTAASSPQAASCPECGAENAGQRMRCWLCNADLGQPTPTENFYASPPLPAGDISSSYSLSSLMLIMTLIALCLGIGAVAPGLAFVLAIAAVPALIRTTMIVSRRAQTGTASATDDRIRLFLGSLGVVVAIGAASGIAFFAVCVGGGMATLAITESTNMGYEAIGLALVIGIGGGALAGIAVMVWVTRRLWKQRS